MKLIRQILDCPDYVRFQAIGFDYELGRITISLTSVRSRAQCPLCNHTSKSIHSRYKRTLADLPMAGWIVQLQIAVRKFRCRQLNCRRKVFCERLTDVASVYARKTVRFSERISHISLTAGASPGARLGKVLGLPASRNTLLRFIRKRERKSRSTPRVLGIDDWAKRKGIHYGSILVDLEQREVLELLPDRKSTTVATWLASHPGVEIVCRDRAEGYIDGIRKGAPQACQVADRFHLIRNLAKVLQRVFDQHRSALIDREDPKESVEEIQQIEPMLTLQGAQRFANYEKARALHKEGWTMSAIGRYLGIKRHTASK